MNSVTFAWRAQQADLRIRFDEALPSHTNPTHSQGEIAMNGIARSLMGLLAAMALGVVPAGATVSVIPTYTAAATTRQVVRTGATQRAPVSVHALAQVSTARGLTILCPATGC